MSRCADYLKAFGELDKEQIALVKDTFMFRHLELADLWDEGTKDFFESIKTLFYKRTNKLK